MDIRKHKFFEGCLESVRDSCFKRFEKELIQMKDEQIKQKAMDRLDRELQTIEKIGCVEELYLTKQLLYYAESSRRLAYVGGTAEYSYVAYLYGIHNIDPLKHNYPVEVAYGFEYDRTPLMIFRIPEDFIKSTILFLKERFGKEYVQERKGKLHWVIVLNLTGIIIEKLSGFQ